MKIALIIKDLKHCGAQRAIARLSIILNNAGHDVFLILFSSKFIEYEYAGKLIIIDSKIRKSIFGKMISTIQRTIGLKKVKKLYGIEAAISYLDTPNISNILTKGKEKVLVSVRNYKSLNDKGIFYFLNKIMIKNLYPKSNYIIAVSEAIKNDLVKNYKLNSNKIKVIYNPYDINQIIEKQNDNLPEEYKKFYENNKVIITVGRLSKQKGYCNLIKSFAILKKNYNNIKLIIIGDGEQEDQLLTLTKELKLDKDILFAGYQKNPFVFLKNAYIYVMTSLFEGFPNAMVEAMVCSIPVVSVDCKSGPREILYLKPDINTTASTIELADYGIICPPFEQESWDVNEITKNHIYFSRAIEILLNNENLYNKYSRKAFERAKHFSYEQCRKKYEDLIVG